MDKRNCFLHGLLLMGLLLALLAPVYAQDKAEDEKIWASFAAWVQTNPEKVGLRIYEEKLIQDGLTPEAAKRQIDALRRIFKEHPEKNIEFTYDRIFSKPLTGDPEKDGFTTSPSVFMVESTKDLKPGTALDVGAGQGRNSVWLAQQGWEVTAIDISGGGLAAAAANAEKAGTSISTVKSTYQNFDYGVERWDLIVMILSWAPVSDPDFVTRLKASLRPGGVIVFEHVLSTEKQSFPAYVQALPPNSLLSHFSVFHIQKYEEGIWPGDWGGPPAALVRTIVAKKNEEIKVAKKFEFSMITIMRIQGGRIIEEWQEDDQLGFARQLGMELKPKEDNKKK
jgi:2-polyprenyl-3-methyl-5-hydroxy-6-metoxy-1,4-benzoquinol methylase